MRSHITSLNAIKFHEDMENIGRGIGEDVNNIMDEEESNFLVVMYDNWQKQKRVELSKIVGGDAKFLSFIVGYYIRSQPTQIDLSRIGQVNYQFERKDCEAALLRCEDSLIDETFLSLFAQFPKANHSISILDTSNFPPIEANSSSEKDINDEVIDSCLINTMKGHKRFIFSGSDPEPSFIHEKLTNKRLHLNDEDPIKHIELPWEDAYPDACPKLHQLLPTTPISCVTVLLCWNLGIQTRLGFNIT